MNVQLFRLRFTSRPVLNDPVGAQKGEIEGYMISLAKVMACHDGCESQIEQSKGAVFFPDGEGPRETLASTSSQASGNAAAEAKFQLFVCVGQM
jgi:hypothetical protein